MACAPLLGLRRIRLFVDPHDPAPGIPLYRDLLFHIDLNDRFTFFPERLAMARLKNVGTGRGSRDLFFLRTGLDDDSLKTGARLPGHAVLLSPSSALVRIWLATLEGCRHLGHGDWYFSDCGKRLAHFLV